MADPYAASPIERSPAYRFMIYGLRCYLLGLLTATIYTVTWFVDLTDTVNAQTLAALWVLIIALGAAFLFVLIPMFFRRRLSLY